MSHPAAALQPPRILVLGAGWLGRALAESMAADGVRVTTVRRSSHQAVQGGAAFAFDLARVGTADMSEPIPTELLGHDVIVAAVAPDRGRGDDYAHTYPVAARAATRIAHSAGAKAIAWVSSTGVYGVTDGREVTETSPREATGASNAALCLAEDIILADAQESRRVGVFRASGLYGPGRDPAERFRDPQSIRGRSDHWVNLAWRDDVVSALRWWVQHALTHLGSAVASPQLLNVSDGTPLTVAECARLVAVADGRTFVPPADDESAPPSRSNQRIRIDALRSIGWTPDVPNLRSGLERLGYSRLSVSAQPYGPQSSQVRRFLRDLAALSLQEHDAACARWRALREVPAFPRADRALGEAIVRANREAERDAAAAPLMQMLRNAEPHAEAEAGRSAASKVPDSAMDPIAEPALAALMSLIVRDVLPDDVFALLTGPLALIVPEQ